MRMKSGAIHAFLVVCSLSVVRAEAQDTRPLPETAGATPPATVAVPAGATWVRPTQFDLDPPVKRSPARTLLRTFRVAFGTQTNLRLLGGIGAMAPHTGKAIGL